MNAPSRTRPIISEAAANPATSAVADSTALPYVESTDLLGRPEALRERARRDGYLHFEGLVPREVLLALRAEFADILERRGWLDPGTRPIEALTTQAPRIEGTDDYWPVFDDFQSLESFHALPHHPRILDVFDRLFGETPLPHPRNIVRIIFPRAIQHSTPAHQDYFHIQGTPNTWTCWIPLDDAPQELGGGLALLPGSHRDDIHPVRPSLGAGSYGIDETRLRGEWHQGPMAMGDVLIFHSHTVHKGMPNLTDNRLRLSVDYRYQPASEPICAESLKPHFNRKSWDEIYAGWTSTRHQRYWAAFDLTVVEHAQAANS